MMLMITVMLMVATLQANLKHKIVIMIEVMMVMVT